MKIPIPTPPDMGADGKYQVPVAKVRFAAGVAEDEIDLESGFIMMPQAIPQPASVPVSDAATMLTSDIGSTVSPGGVAAGSGVAVSTPGATAQKVVEIAFSADRSQLFTAWNAVANLADLAGKVSVKLHAESENGFDRNKLQNGVIEPLKEADLID